MCKHDELRSVGFVRVIYEVFIFLRNFVKKEKTMENKQVFKIIQIVLDIMCFGLFLGYMCDTPEAYKGCYPFG